jgi:hypothetical protein
MRWAAALAALAEILKGRPLRGSRDTQQAARDQDRTEFTGLFAHAKSLLLATH